MSKLLYLECSMGAAGDMLAAALYELLEDAQKQEFLHLVNEHGISGVEVLPEDSVKCGVKGTHMSVRIHGEEEEAQTYGVEDMHHEHCHEHQHEKPHHEHHHTSLADVHAMIHDCQLPEKVKEDACKVYDLLAVAESHAHGVEVSEIHFHEVGMLDAVADVLNVCLLIYMLKPEKIVVSPVNTGFGCVHCAHGILPVPAPATAYLLQGAPTYSGNMEGEMCTPTGAALLMFIKTEFNKQPIMAVEKTGYGMGKKDFPQANCVRSFFGCDWNSQQERVVALSCNIDDMTGEALGFAADVLRDAGALDVFITPIQMKKNRPGHMLTCLCRSEQVDEMAGLMLKHTTSWGIRKQYYDRYVLERHTEEWDSPYGMIRVRCGEGYGVKKWKPEFEDVVQAAKKYNVSVQEVIHSIIQR